MLIPNAIITILSVLIIVFLIVKERFTVTPGAKFK